MQIDHINLVVPDLDRMIAFYRELLRAEGDQRATITGDFGSARPSA
jgi:catechol 2,3-dioxygenase-like lactoylglutathione lyase family enzyme